MIVARYTILLTACINPNGMSFTFLQDAAEREKQYINAIEYYLENTKFNIVFCNNSGEDISSKISKKSERIEFLSFNGNDYDRSLGKGYGEVLILEYALKNSVFIRRTDYVIKITGRLIVNNLIESIHLTNVIWIFMKNKMYFNKMYFDANIIDSKCFISSKSFLEKFLLYRNRLNDTKEYYFEHLLFALIYELKLHNKICLFCPSLEFLGVSGSTGEVFKQENKSLSKKLIEIREYLQVIKQKNEITVSRYLYLSMISTSIRIVKAVFKRLK